MFLTVLEGTHEHEDILGLRHLDYFGARSGPYQRKYKTRPNAETVRGLGTQQDAAKLA